jgi:hypothetical protein
MTVEEFWGQFDYQLFSELALFFMACFLLGYSIGWKLYAFRRLASSAS